MVRNNYPRIHSVSTVGIIYHFNADYLFHPFRTDFTGEGGSGKTMISDIIQLVLLGPGNYHSATEGTDKRPIDGMVVQPKSKQYGAGYLIMNVEVSPAKFLVMGCFIEKSSKQTKMFIAQAGFDWEEKLEFLSAPVYHKDFLVNDKIVSVEELNKALTHVHLKPLTVKIYHRLLYNNGILSIDLSNKKRLDSYASIFRSFSRGKGLKTSSENLKDFLFGDDEKMLMASFDQHVKSISNDYHEHERYQNEIELIKRKQGYIKEIVQLEQYYQELENEYRTEKVSFWAMEEKKASERYGSSKLSYERSNLELCCVNVHAASIELEELKLNVNQYLQAKSKLEGLHDGLEELRRLKESKYAKVGEINLKLGKADHVGQLLQAHENKDQLRSAVLAEQRFDREKRLLENFSLYLKNNGILASFESSFWNGDFEKAKQSFELEHASEFKKREELTALTIFSDIKNEHSLAGWAIANLDRPLSREEESILIHFQKLPRQRPEPKETLTRYLPKPELLFDRPDIRDGNERGFWLNLDGVFEHINYVVRQFLHTDKETILSVLSQIKSELDVELKECGERLLQMENLKEILFDFEQLKSVLPLYNLKENYSRVPRTEYLIDIDQLEQDLIYFDSREALIEQRDIHQGALEELFINQDLIDADRLKEEMDKALQYFKENKYAPERLDDIVWKLTQGLEDRKSELSILSAELGNEDLEIELIYNGLLREVQTSAACIRLQLEKERVFRQDEGFFKTAQQNLNLSQDKLSDAQEEYFRFFKLAFAGAEFGDRLADPDLGDEKSLKERWSRAKIKFEEKYGMILDELEDGRALEGSFHVGQLAHRLLPTVFTTAKSVKTESVDVLLADKLEDLHQAIKEIGSRKLEILKRVFSEVYQTYRDYILKITDIEKYFNGENKTITGGSRAALIMAPSVDYPSRWMSVFSKTLSNELSYTGLFEDLTRSVDINEMMKQAFVAEGGTKNVKIEDLLNPKSYFDLDFKLKLDSGENNSGSNSQAYSGYALLGLARLSLIEDAKRPGIRIMPIDEAQGLGSNYEMLREIALEEGYQILSMSIESAGETREGEQYIYMLSENRLQDEESYVPAMGIFSDGEVISDINNFVDGRSDQSS